MILPVVAYGSPVLRKVATDIDKNYEGLPQLIENMWETMYKADGVGLAAPQVGLPIRIFVIDTASMEDKDESLKTFKKVFINAHIVEEDGEPWAFNEGCLSLPGIREDVKRKSKIRIKYVDENFNVLDEVYDGIKARVIQHEYDHIEGVVFTDRLTPLKRRILKSKLSNIAKGKVDIGYKMKFPL
ncbi:MAG: peptide deformylase [Bacteroidetes bacterium GWF2_38_335]|nr:MAG: peptide deformylase [Bacteroidetes bacterium GWF2_38_335]OFY78297.1 MAG: peptide deformylase [Bacteroidetes bacterium RIFOXYA12_FULL_38_20]HBS87508.1 peptide deformylase [Bacteroidales bacterium]